MNFNKTGLWGEIYAARYLRDHGYEIIAGNYRCRMGEIDVIARKDGTVCFVEVKTRNPSPLARPMESVDTVKQQRLISAALYYIRTAGEETASRFDVIEVTLDENDLPVKIHHLKNAFT